MFLALVVKNGIFAYLTLKITFSHKNKKRKGLPSENEVLHLFLASFVDI